MAAAVQLPMGPAPTARLWLNVDRSNQLSIKDWKQKTEEGRWQMKERYKYIMKEVDVACGGAIESHHERAVQFMDVCCCPGGFSEYTLLALPNARGVGLSLPVELGGHIPSFETYDAQDGTRAACVLKDDTRYEMHFVDVTTVAHNLYCGDMFAGDIKPIQALKKVQNSSMVPSEFQNQCDFMILDGSFLGGKSNIYMETKYSSDAQNPAFNCYINHIAANQALLAAQLAIMFSNLKQGGKVVLRMSMTWSYFTIGVLALLRRIFKGDIINYKPRSCHQDAISYYLVCYDFDLAKARALRFKERMVDMVGKLRAGGPQQEFVNFPEVPEGQPGAILRFWGQAMLVYHLPLWLFRKLSEESLDSKLSEVGGHKAGRARPCWRHLVFKNTRWTCTPELCTQGAHSAGELHVLVKVAFNLLQGRLYFPCNEAGQLAPGQGNMRDEENEVYNKVTEWLCERHAMDLALARDQAHRLSLQMVYGVQAVPIAQQVWQHMLQIAGNECLQHFRAVMNTMMRGGMPGAMGGMGFGSGGGQAAQPALLSTSMQQAMMLLKGGAGRGPGDTAGQQGTGPGGRFGPQAGGRSQLAALAARAGLSGRGGMGGRGGGGMPGVPADNGQASLAAPNVELVGGRGDEGDGEGGVGDEFGDTLGEGDALGDDGKLSGYVLPFLTLQPEDMASHAAMVDFFGG